MPGILSFIHPFICVSLSIPVHQDIHLSLTPSLPLSILPSFYPTIFLLVLTLLTIWTKESENSLKENKDKDFLSILLSLYAPISFHLLCFSYSITQHFLIPQDSYGDGLRWVLSAGEGNKFLGDSLVSGTDENLSLKESSSKPKKRADGQSDLLRVKSIKVHQIQSSCFLRVTNLCWKLRKTKGEKCF